MSFPGSPEPCGDTTLELKVSEPWFSWIASGAKTVEGRRLKTPDKYATWCGRIVRIRSDEGKEVFAIVTAVRYHENLAAYLDAEGVLVCDPTKCDHTWVKKAYEEIWRDPIVADGMVALEIRLC